MLLVQKYFVNKSNNMSHTNYKILLGILSIGGI